MFTFAYPARFRRDEGGRVVVSFPDFPTAHPDGANPQEALAEAIDCLGSCIAFAMEDSVEVPKPSPLKRDSRWFRRHFGSRVSWRFTGRFGKWGSASPSWRGG